LERFFTNKDWWTSNVKTMFPFREAEVAEDEGGDMVEGDEGALHLFDCESAAKEVRASILDGDSAEDETWLGVMAEYRRFSNHYWCMKGVA
jgi:hypothetical protein